jgi:hypothetical protein
VFEEVQITELVRFAVLPSLNVAVAVNCCVPPWPIEALAGVTSSDIGPAVTSTVTPLEGNSRFPLSSTARLFKVTAPSELGVHT